MGLMKEMFGVEKPVLGTINFLPFPGSPFYDDDGGIKKIRDAAARDAQILVDAGFDGLAFSNGSDRPYISDADKATVAVMSSLISEISSRFRLPFGLSVTADPEAAVAIGAATEANYVRIFLYWDMILDWGSAGPYADALQRFRKNFFTKKTKVFANISGNTELSGGRCLEDIANGAVRFALADALCLSGTTAGETVLEDDIKAARAGSLDVPLVVAMGDSLYNVASVLALSDAIIVDTYPHPDSEKTAVFIKKVREIRKNIKSGGDSQ
ncbi:sgc region protein SgcQ [Synergistales bacterium]|nr:sgc region protein SgcQ [Synergistales bacterium]